MQSQAPAPDGQTWVGYISNEYHYEQGPAGTPAERYGFALDFGLPPGPGGGPYAGPFTARLRLGGRRTDMTPPTSPIDCSRDSCNLDNRPDDPSAPPYSTLVRDVVVTGAGHASTGLGQKVRLPFRANYAGAAPPGPFALDGDSNLPGATERPSSRTYNPRGAGITPLSVEVTTPDSAASGTYRVALSVIGPNGEKRFGFATLALDGERPRILSLRLSDPVFPTASAAAFSQAAGTRVRFRLSEAGRVVFRVRRILRGRRIRIRGSFSRRGRAGTNSFRFRGRIGGRALPPGRYELLARAVDAAGNRGARRIARFRVRAAGVVAVPPGACGAARARAAC